MRNKITQAELVKKRGEQAAKRKKYFSDHAAVIERIKKSPNTKVIKYEDYKKAFDYVDSLFPSSRVKEAVLYSVDFKLLEFLGYGGAGGFYDRLFKIIVISSYIPRNPYKSYYTYEYDPKAEASRDEVIVHELCHYCYVEEGGIADSRMINEEFAYGWSTGYLKSKGYTDDFIIKKNFFPYLVDEKSQEALKWVISQAGVTESQYNHYSDYRKKEFFMKYGKKWDQKRKEMAYKWGKEIIEVYEKRRNGEPLSNSNNLISYPENRFDLLDI